MTLCDKILIYSSSGFMAIIMFCLFFILPVSEIYIGVVYKDVFICESPISSYVSLTNWLIIKGVSTIISLLFLFPCIFSSKKSSMYCISCVLNYIINICILFWLVVGSFMFWYSCPNIQPILINNYLWISLIVGYINLCNAFTYYRIRSSHNIT